MRCTALVKKNSTYVAYARLVFLSFSNILFYGIQFYSFSSFSAEDSYYSFHLFLTT